MERGQPNEHRLRGLFMSPKANSPGERLQIARIFRQTNFGMGKERKYFENFLSLSARIAKQILNDLGAVPSSQFASREVQYSHRKAQDARNKFQRGQTQRWL